jgi:predicted metal-dependent hydrolase
MLFKNKKNKAQFSEEKLSVNGVEFDVFVKVSKGNSVSAKINNGVMFIHIPRRLNKKEKLLAKQRIQAKLVKKLEKLDKTELEVLKLKKFLIKENSKFSILNSVYTVKVSYTQTKQIRTKLNSSIREIILPMHLQNKNNDEIISKKFKKAISKEFIPHLKAIIQEINSQYYNLHFNHLRIHNSNGLWGSYSRSTKNIHLNFKLLFAPEEIIRYVIIHELSHITFPNHNKEFWDNVSIACPDYLEKRKWLRKNGNKLGYFNQ